MKTRKHLKCAVKTALVAVLLSLVSIPAFAFDNVPPPPTHDLIVANQSELDRLIADRFQIIIRFVIGETALTINGVTWQIEAAPFIAYERTMVPIGVIAEAMGAEVGWDGATQTVSISHGDINLSLVIGQPLPNNMGVPVIEADRTFVPLAYVAGMMNAATRWDGDAQAVYVTIIGADFVLAID